MVVNLRTLNKDRNIDQREKNKLGEINQKIVIPRKYRERIMKLGHESVSCHLGATKTKDKICRNFFWPNCYKEIEDYVKTCQRVGYQTTRRKRH